MPTVLQIVHGYPPREVAGTELATQRLVRGLTRRGWRCHVLASTRAPGHAQGSVLELPGEAGVTRLVNNLPHRPLSDLERDRGVEEQVRRLLSRLAPDVVHVQHLAFLSSGLRFEVPAVGTLHDHWPWCPAGGTMLRPGLAPCPGPDPAWCARCHAAVARLPGRVEHAAVRVADSLARFVAPESLHRAWRGLPLGLRSRLRGPPLPAGTAAAAAERRAAVTAAWNALDARMAPSAFLAGQALRFGIPGVQVVPTGLDGRTARIGGGPIVVLGSILPHKGLHVVVAAYREVQRACRVAPPLAIHGDPSADPAYARGLGWPIDGPVTPEQVPALLARATALVVGSVWPENAPLVVLEARAAGCPVVAPRIGGLPELVEDGRDGFLYTPGDATALAGALLRLLGPDTGHALDVRPPPSLDAHAEAVEAVYRGAIAHHFGQGRMARETNP